MRNILPFPALGRGSALVIVLALSACALDNPLRDTRYSACHVLGSSDWKAQVEFSSTASPIPYLTRKLVVTGKVTTAALEDMREQGWQVHPICAYTVSFLDQHPEYADLLA